MRKLIKELVRKNLIEHKNIMGKEIVPNKIVYHQSSNKNRESILKNGLTPSVGECYFLFSRGGDIKTKDDCIPAIFATDSNDKNDFYSDEHDYDIWEINTKLISNKWYKDGNFPDTGYNNYVFKHIVTLDRINLNSIRLIHSGSD